MTLDSTSAVSERKLCLTVLQPASSMKHIIHTSQFVSMRHEQSWKLELRFCILVLSRSSQAVLGCMNCLRCSIEAKQ